MTSIFQKGKVAAFLAPDRKQYPKLVFEIHFTVELSEYFLESLGSLCSRIILVLFYRCVRIVGY
jgi:hypothetical protein